MKGEVDFLANFPIDTSPKKKTHSALLLEGGGSGPRPSSELLFKGHF